MAAILRFPHVLAGEALYARWTWLSRHHSWWRNEATDGADDDGEAISFDLDSARTLASAMGSDFSEHTMRRDIGEWKAIVEKRVRVKDWLESLGVDWGKVETPEQALSFVFDRFHVGGPPPAA